MRSFSKFHENNRQKYIVKWVIVIAAIVLAIIGAGIITGSLPADWFIQLLPEEARPRPVHRPELPSKPGDTSADSLKKLAD